MARMVIQMAEAQRVQKCARERARGHLGGVGSPLAWSDLTSGVNCLPSKRFPGRVRGHLGGARVLSRRSVRYRGLTPETPEIGRFRCYTEGV